MAQGGYMYIMSDTAGVVLYIGVTGKLREQVEAHTTGQTPVPDPKQALSKLLYYEYFASIKDATRRKEQLGKWSRERMEELIRFNNPERKDQSDTIAEV